MVKFYGEEYSEGDLLSDFERNGFEAGRLERGGRLLLMPEEEPLGGERDDQLGRLVEEAEDGRTVWASFDWVRPIELEKALEQQKRLTDLVDARQLVVKTAALEEALGKWPASQLRQVQSAYSAIILASEEAMSMSRSTPMPPS